MPRRLHFRVRAVDELHRQLVYAPEDARLRQMRGAETLLDEIGAMEAVLESTVTWRITGYRPDAARRDGDAMLVGVALRADLAVFVQRLSETLTLTADDRPGGAETVEALAARLGIAVRTVQRWRRLGLVTHWMRFGGDEAPRLGCYVERLEAFRAIGGLAESPRRGRRALSPLRQEAIVADARHEVERTGDGLSVVAAEIARRHDRSPDAVRRLLIRHDRAAERPIFAPRGLAPAHLRRLVERAWRWGVPAAKVARRCGRSEPALHRQLMIARAARLRSLRLEWIELPTFAIAEADSIILNAPAAQERLSRLRPGPDAHATLAAIRARDTTDDDCQEARLAASGLLRRRAAAAIADLLPSAVPAPSTLDAIESDLRWALALLLTAVADELPRAVRRGEGSAGRPAERLAGELLRGLLEMAVHVVASTLPTLDPARRQRPSRRVALQMDKALAQSGWGEPRGRAVAVVPASAPMTTDPCADLWPWQAVVDLPPRWAEREASLPPREREALRLRHGLDGARPKTVAEIAATLGVTPSHAERLAHAAETRLRCPRAQ